MKDKINDLESIIDETELAILALSSTMLCEYVGICALQNLLADVGQKAKRLLELENKNRF
ncbi:hypothetical protein [Vibrio quintilis]|uniref:Uncharacterized protein n=1 Tax=Vibrio quintilis TaxID=1117707 RepID=A0A1M7YP92_9VIBR|nr:hypothetical protein [Vibrio quintilis]SHO54438.1 hypothetical protein VQ7734_00152 [Vibrio quintilis]